jgi:hypothetical protein
VIAEVPDGQDATETAASDLALRLAQFLGNMIAGDELRAQTIFALIHALLL